MIWGGSDEPCALCQCVSLGAINLANNRAVSGDVCKLLSEAWIHLFVPRKDCSTFFYFLRQKRHLQQIMHHWNWYHVELEKKWESDILECVQAPFNIKPDRTYVEFRDVSRENMVLFNLIFLNPLLSCFSPTIFKFLCHTDLPSTTRARDHSFCLWIPDRVMTAKPSLVKLRRCALNS
jgi:hypothetical protein